MKLYLTMPKPGETIREGAIIKWLKKEGDAVEEKEALVELETEKAVFTYESPFKGVIEKILAEENTSIPVGSPIALYEVSEEDGQRYLMLGVGMPKEGEMDPSPKNSYSPLIRNLAKEHGLLNEELDLIPRSDSSGRLTKEDVLGYLKTRWKQDEVSPLLKLLLAKEKEMLSPIRNRIAQHMKKSHEQIPQAASGVDVDMSEVWEYCKIHQLAFQNKHQLNLSPFHFFFFMQFEKL